MPVAKKVTEGKASPRPVAIRPTFVSQHNATAVLGFKNGRAFLEMLPWLSAQGCRVVTRGKDRLVLLDEAEGALLRLARGEHIGPAATSEPETVGSVLARIGYRVAAGGSR